MAPTNRLIEARRAELRAEADKQRAASSGATDDKAKKDQPTVRPKAKAKS